MTEAQKQLWRKHGTPQEFANACMAAIGEISLDEAMVAIDKYRAEWKAAGETK